MDPELVLRKTDKGRDEIATRAHRLDAHRRRILILVDGTSSADAIAAKVAGFDDGMSLLDALLAGGFVEAVGEGGAAPGASSAAPGAAASTAAPAVRPPAAPLPDSLDALKRLACTQIERLMGPDGDPLALRIERTGTREELFAEARKVHGALSAFLGAKKAESFARALGL